MWLMVLILLLGLSSIEDALYLFLDRPPTRKLPVRVLLAIYVLKPDRDCTAALI